MLLCSELYIEINEWAIHGEILSHRLKQKKLVTCDNAKFKLYPSAVLNYRKKLQGNAVGRGSPGEIVRTGLRKAYTPFTRSSKHRANIEQTSSKRRENIELIWSMHKAWLTRSKHRASIEQTLSWLVQLTRVSWTSQLYRVNGVLMSFWGSRMALLFYPASFNHLLWL